MSIHVDTSQFWKYANQTENRGKYFSLKIQPKINFSGEVDEPNNFAQKAKFSSEKTWFGKIYYCQLTFLAERDNFFGRI